MIDIDYGIELKILFMSVGGLVCVVGIELKTLFMSVGGLLELLFRNVVRALPLTVLLFRRGIISVVSGIVLDERGVTLLT